MYSQNSTEIKATNKLFAIKARTIPQTDFRQSSVVQQVLFVRYPDADFIVNYKNLKFQIDFALAGNGSQWNICRRRDYEISA